MGQTLITNGGNAKLSSALVGGTKVQVVSFSTGYTSGSVTVANTTVPGQNYGPTPVNSAIKTADDSAQYECIVPEPAGSFAINVIGLFDQDGDLFAITKLDTDFQKIAQNLPNNVGNRLVFRDQLLINNIAAVMNWTLNTATVANLNFVNIPSDLTDLANVGQYKTYRVVTMPDSDADVAMTDGSNWTFGRYISDFTGTTSGSASGNTKVKGSSVTPFKSYHVGSIIQITSGALQYKVRAITAVDETANEATVNTAYGSTPGSGITFIVHSRPGNVPLNLIPFGIGKLVATLKQRSRS